MYSIRRGSDGIFHALYVVFDPGSSMIAEKLFHDRTLSKDRLKVLSVQYSKTKITFKVVLNPGQNEEDVIQLIQKIINIGSLMNQSGDLFKNIFGGRL